MAKVEQKYLIDKEGLEHLIAMLKDALKSGATDEEIWEQSLEILNSQYRTRTNQAFKEMRKGRTTRFKTAEDMIRDLESD